MKDALQANASCYRKNDWWTLALTSIGVFIIYYLTLPPEVTLSLAGIFATGGAYASPPFTPGMPLWTLYAWAFTKLVPVSNIAWRIALSSAVAAALASGVVALMVARGSSALIAALKSNRCLGKGEEFLVCGICGAVAGSGFAFHPRFWKEAIGVEPTALAMLLFAMSLCFLLRWFLWPPHRQYFYGAVLVYGMSLAVDLSLIVAAPALPMIVLFRKSALGRDLYLGIAALLAVLLGLAQYEALPTPIETLMQLDRNLSSIYLAITVLSALLAAAMIWRTRRLLNQWRRVCLAGLAFLLPLLLYLYLAVASMTNPPVNWGYARTVEGFSYLIGRGQFEVWTPVNAWSSYLRQMGEYLQETFANLGFFYGIAAIIPLCFLGKLKRPARGWVLGLVITFTFFSLLLVAVLNFPPGSLSHNLPNYFSAADLILSMLAGYGLALLAATLHGRGAPHINMLPVGGKKI